MRPDKLSFSATHVVKAARALTWPEKAVWLEDWALDQGPEGAWITADKLAERLGLSASTVDAYRRRLAAAGLHERLKRPGARSPGWVATLPDGCDPRTQRPAPEVVVECARRLDWILEKAGWRSGMKPDDGAVSVERPYGFKPDGGTVSGGRGETPSSVSRRETTVQPAVDFEDGEGARAPQAEAGGSARRSAIPRNPTSSSGTESGKRIREQNRPLNSQEIRDFLDSLERDVREGRMTREQADRLRRIAI